MSKISVCLIVKNEEKFLEDCLASVEPIAREIILVDTGSTDATIAIAKRFSNCKILPYTWDDDFSGPRNHSLAHASSEWILVIDADETVHYEDYEAILRATEAAHVDGYYMLTCNYTNNYTKLGFVPSNNKEKSKGLLGWTPSHKTRLFRNKPEYRFRGIIHEVVDPSILEARGTIEELHVPIHHFGQQRHDAEKLGFYKRLAEKKMRAEPDNPMCYYELGQILVAAGEVDEGIEAFEKGIQINPSFGDLRYGNLFYEIGNVYYQIKNNLEKALEYYMQAVRVRPGFQHVYSMIGSVYRKMEKLYLAEAFFHEAIFLGGAVPNTYYDLGWIRIKQNRHKEAAELFQKVVDMAPTYSGAYNNLAICYHLSGENDRAYQTWKKGLEHDPGNKEIIFNINKFEDSNGLLRTEK